MKCFFYAFDDVIWCEDLNNELKYKFNMLYNIYPQWNSLKKPLTIKKHLYII